jgi:hypothetical protein
MTRSPLICVCSLFDAETPDHERLHPKAKKNGEGVGQRAMRLFLHKKTANDKCIHAGAEKSADGVRRRMHNGFAT